MGGLMKRKKVISIILILATVMILAACSNKAGSPKILTREGISPYELSESERYVLQSFGMEGNSQIISFHAPKEAITLNTNVYKMENGRSWSSMGSGGISIGMEREPTNELTGTFTMKLKENYAMELNINSGGARATYNIDEIMLETETLASTKDFLQEFQKIEINKEIPVAIMVYDSGREMSGYSVEDYFHPEKFHEMDLVQVVTLTFTDKEF